MTSLQILLDNEVKWRWTFTVTFEQWTTMMTIARQITVIQPNNLIMTFWTMKYYSLVLLRQIDLLWCSKKSLMISKRLSESVYRRRTDTTMAKYTNNDLQNSTWKTKDRATRTLLKTGDELMCSGRTRSSCSSSATCRVTLVTMSVISRERGKDWEVLMTKIFGNV